MRQEAMTAFARDALGLSKSVSVALVPLNKKGVGPLLFPRFVAADGLGGAGALRPAEGGECLLGNHCAIP